MVEACGLRFETSIGVLYALKEARGHKTLHETYTSIAVSQMDNILDVLRVCCEKGENRRMTDDEFMSVLAQHEIGFVKLTNIFTQVIEKMMYSGMTPAEVDEAKKQLMARMKQA